MLQQLARRRRPSSGQYYQLLASMLGLLPLRRYAAANWLMARPGLQTDAVCTPYGAWLVAPQLKGSWALPFGLKEPAVEQQIGQLLGHADAFIDCGANLGWYSLLASRAPQVRRVLAVEPVAQSVRYLELVLALNQIDKVEIVQGCVSDHDGTVAFALGEGSFSEHGAVVEHSGAVATVQLPAYTLETLLARLAPARSVCVKLDVEGHERAVLAALSATKLREQVSAVLVEVHLYKFADPLGELEQLCAQLAPLGTLDFLILTPSLHPAYRRLWWHLSRRYPLQRLGLEEVGALISQHAIPELFVIARRAAPPL